MAALFIVELVGGEHLQMMGVHDDSLQHTLLDRFGQYLLGQQAEVAGVYLALGLGLGVIGAGTLTLWELARRRAASPMLRWVQVLGFVFFVEAWRLIVTIIRYPQLFDDALYARGGSRAAFEVALTSHVPLAACTTVGWLLIVVFLGGPALTARGRSTLSRTAARLLARARSHRRRLAMAAATATALTVLGIPLLLRYSGGEGSARAAGERRPNLLILAVDSLRADHVGAGRSIVAPHLAALAGRSVEFGGAHVTIPRTFPSWVTLLSGRWPAHHGIRHMFPPASERRAVGALLPAMLAERGMHTGVVSDFAGEIFSRLDAGYADRDVPYFDMRVVLAQAGFNLHPALFPWVATRLGHRFFPALGAAPENADPDRLADQVIEMIDRLSGRGPFFVTAFFSAPHFPYAAPDPYYRRFTSPAYRGRFRYDKPVAALGNQDGAIGPDDREQILGLYDGAVASVDAAIGRVLGSLARRHLDDNTIVVVLADHGENLYEDGVGMGHGEHLRGDHALHIPLLIYDPVHRFPPHRVGGIVRDVDIAPTLARLVGGALPGPDGVDLMPLLRGERDSLDLAAFAESELWLVPEGVGFTPDLRLPYPSLPALVTLAPDDDIILDPSLRELTIAAKHRALRTERWKLIYQPTRDGVRWSLFDLHDDPDERRDVAQQHPDVVSELGGRLLAWATLDGSTVEGGFVVPPHRREASRAP